MDAEVGGDRVEEGDRRGKRAGGEKEDAVASNGDCSIDVRSRIRERYKGEDVCRICHLDRETSSKDLKLIPLGCDCKGELGFSHQHCAEAWFRQKGDRICEICGKTAKNISNTEEETSTFMMEWNEMRMMAASLDTNQESSRRCKLCFCNLLLACLVLVFLLLWLFRGINVMFSS